MSTTHDSEGRFGNQVFRGLALHFLAKKNNLKATYKDEDRMKRLGIDLFTEGERDPSSTLKLYDTNFYAYITIGSLRLDTHVSLHNAYCQTAEFTKYIYNYFNSSEIKEKIINKNVYKERFQANNDVFIHVRLGDVTHLATDVSYYHKVLSSLSFDNGYIASDSIDHEICKELIERYDLKVVDKSDVETIMFASTCKYIIISKGTFSWLLGALGFFSKVWYPSWSWKMKGWWGPDIYSCIPEWESVEY